MIDTFETKAKEWDNPEKVNMTTKFVAILEDKIKLEKNWKALEIGAGTGLVGLRVLNKVKKIIFEDTSAAMLKVLKSKLSDTEKVEILEAEVTEYKKSDIDFVFSCMAFHHIADIKLTIKHIHNIMRSGGILAIGDLETEDGSFHQQEKVPHNGFNTTELASICSDTGFIIKECLRFHTMVRPVGTLTKEYHQFLLIAEKP